MLKSCLTATLLIFLCFSHFSGTAPESLRRAAPQNDHVETSDILRFWRAYELIRETDSRKKQLAILKKEFFQTATAGQKAMFKARRYTPEEYLQTINDYPTFWETVRQQTLQADHYGKQIEKGIVKLKGIYPDLRPANIYFTIGALRSNGTTLGNKVLIGSELALGDSLTELGELPEKFDYLKDYFKNNPVQGIVFLNLHEYVHTQQKTTVGESLLAKTLIEGVAEWTAEMAMERPSPNPQIAFGKSNDLELKAAFAKEMFSPDFSNWLWNSSDNPYGMRDLAYYLGYAICESYYQKANDKALAIKTMIELDYNNAETLANFVDASGYFDSPIEVYQTAFELQRPRVVKVEQLPTPNTLVDPTTTQIRVVFSEPMDRDRIATEVGTLGAKHVPKIEKTEFLEDGKILIYTVTLQPKTDYEMVLHWTMRSLQGYPLVPYTLKFSTGK
ncbi:MAG: Ig-like domain-containing protein [Salibacteraceae bacterium]